MISLSYSVWIILFADGTKQFKTKHLFSETHMQNITVLVVYTINFVLKLIGLVPFCWVLHDISPLISSQLQAIQL